MGRDMKEKKPVSTTDQNQTDTRKKKQLVILAVFLVAVIALLAITQFKDNKVEEPADTQSEPEATYIQKATGKYSAGTHHAIIHVKDYGDIEVELNAAVAPIAVSNFCNLAENHFYNNLTFHRIIPGFMIQGGDPNGDGTGGGKQTIKGEFAANGVTNNISHQRGVISMARSQDFNSASSQFFIMQEDDPSLDGNYAAFGHVVKGMDVVDKICEDNKPSDESGLIPRDKQPIIESIEIVD